MGDATTFLHDEHVELKRRFRAYRATHAGLDEILDRIEAHLRAEEEIFDPAVGVHDAHEDIRRFLAAARHSERALLLLIQEVLAHALEQEERDFPRFRRLPKRRRAEITRALRAHRMKPA
jgi:hypothetical protein